MAITPNYGIRYPDVYDDLNVGAIDIQHVAEDTDITIKEQTRPRYFYGQGSADGIVAADGWVRVPLNAVVAASSDFSLSGDSLTLTYTGASGRWHMLGFGAQITGGESDQGLRLVTNGVVAQQLNAYGIRTAVAATRLANMATGDTFAIEASTPSGPATFGGHLTILGGA